MNVWIFVINALFTPVVAPLGVSMDVVEPTPVTAPERVAASITTEPRFHGIERLLAELEADEG